jgi:hypothetical protein
MRKGPCLGPRADRGRDAPTPSTGCNRCHCFSVWSSAERYKRVYLTLPSWHDFTIFECR